MEDTAVSVRSATAERGAAAVHAAGAAVAASASPRVRIQEEDFDPGAELQALCAGDPGIGAVVAFVGLVRDRETSRPGAAAVQVLELEHYPGMTEDAIERMVDEAVARFGLRAARVVHRVGRLDLQARIVLVLAAAPHRGAAFQGCEFLIDYLKTQAPFWKKEHSPDGAAWVDARVADDAALARWGIVAGNAAAPHESGAAAVAGPADAAAAARAA